MLCPFSRIISKQSAMAFDLFAHRFLDLAAVSDTGSILWNRPINLLRKWLVAPTAFLPRPCLGIICQGRCSCKIDIWARLTIAFLVAFVALPSLMNDSLVVLFLLEQSFLVAPADLVLVLLLKLGCPWPTRDPPASASRMLELKACAPCLANLFILNLHEEIACSEKFRSGVSWYS